MIANESKSEHRMATIDRYKYLLVRREGERGIK